MSTTSPFLDNRFEHEIKHLYYINESIYNKLEHVKPSFLIGSRGTGKTTLLKSLSWEQRIQNKDLLKKVNFPNFEDFIGIYIKLPDAQLQQVSVWLSQEEDENLQGLIYSRYLELIQIQAIIECATQLQEMERVSFSADAEFKFVKGIIADYNEEIVNPRFSPKPPRTLMELGQSIRWIRKSIESASQRLDPISECLASIGHPASLCALSHRFAVGISRMIAKRSYSNTPILKICFDEAENLDRLGIRIISSWIRLCQGPLSYVVSFVSKPESLTETALNNLSNQNADVNYINLDETTDADFRSFAEGVVTLRVHEYFRKKYAEGLPADYEFSTEDNFGKLNLNFLLEDLLSKSENEGARDLLRRSLMASDTDSLSRTPQRSSRQLNSPDDIAPPIYQTYITERVTRLKRQNLNGTKLQKRKISSQVLRKSMVGAYLGIFHDLKSHPRYAYADMIIQLSDSCIRDYLSNIENIYRSSKLQLLEFLLSRKIKWTHQNAGLAAAAKAKENLIPSSGIATPSQTAKLVRGLGQLTAMLQRSSENGSIHLTTPERGIFRVENIPADESATPSLMKIIIEGCETNFFKLIERTDTSIRFRMHTSLAPEFGYSYRGAYNDTNISLENLLEICRASDDNEIRKISNRLFLLKDSFRSADLFEESEKQ